MLCRFVLKNMYKYIKKNAHNSTQNDKKNNKFPLQDTADTLSSGTYTATRRPFSRSSFPQVCKEALFALKRSLVCSTKKPCLECKEALFANRANIAGIGHTQNGGRIGKLSTPFFRHFYRQPCPERLLAGSRTPFVEEHAQDRRTVVYLLSCQRRVFLPPFLQEALQPHIFLLVLELVVHAANLVHRGIID